MGGNYSSSGSSNYKSAQSPANKSSSKINRNHSPVQKIYCQKVDDHLNQIEGVWNDDDEIYQSKNLSQTISTQDLIKLLKIQVKSSQKIIKLKSKDSQTIPVMVSLSSDNIKKETQKQSVKQQKQTRPGIDLICVIDVSGSMSGQKIQLVKKSLSYIVELLGESDRISLITFESFGTRLIPLLKVAPKNIREIEKAIESLSGRGGTSIFAGMEMAFKTLRQKKYKNNVESVFLLSDGLDSGADTKITQVLNSDIKLLKSSAFSVHTFGYGSDHDPKLMKNIADLRDGNFFFIEKYQTLDEAVANCMGGLFSVIAQEINVTVRSDLLGIFSDIRIVKAFGDISIYNSIKNQYNIKFSQFFSGISKNLVFQVSIPPFSHEIGDLQRSQVLVSALANVKPVGKGENIDLKGQLVVTFLNESQELKETDPDADVMQNYLRVKAVQLMKQNLRHMQQKKYDLVQQNIQKMEKQLQGYKLSDKSDKLMNMKNDMKKMKVQMQKQDYVNGMNFMMQNQRCHSRERNFAYQNQCQAQMISKVKSKRSKY